VDLKPNAGFLSLFAARASAALVSFAANVYLAGVLGPDEFGRYSFALAILTFAGFFMDSGYFASGARLIAGAQDDELKRGYAGVLMAIGTVTSVLYVGVIVALGLIVDHVFPDRVGSILLAVALLAPAMVAPLVLDQTLKASGRVHLLSAWQTMPRGLFLVAILGAGAAGRLNALTALALSLLASFVTAVLVSIIARPRFRDLVPRLREVATEQRRFGRHLFVGRLANLASYSTDKLLLGFFRGAQAVGYYSLAMNFASLVAMFAQSVAAASFTEFANRRPISARVLRSNALGIAATSVAVLVVGNLVVFLYLGQSYRVVALLLVLSLIAATCQAAYQPYNSWLLANGFGADLKRFLLVVAGVNVLANLVLIPPAGASGAAIASAVGTGAYLIFATRVYRRKVLAGGAS
jgi:O-antigen/teichoic acid export membrane protein